MPYENVLIVPIVMGKEGVSGFRNADRVPMGGARLATSAWRIARCGPSAARPRSALPLPQPAGRRSTTGRPPFSRLVRWCGLPRDAYRPEISTKSALFPRFGQREIGAITASLLSSDLGMVG